MDYMIESFLCSATSSIPNPYMSTSNSLVSKKNEVQDSIGVHEISITNHKAEDADEGGYCICLATMCAIVNKSNQWLFIDRKKNWKGLAFPGGHLEGSESILQCARREILEETGFITDELLYKGITHFYNPVTFQRYLVFNFLCKSFSGTQKDSCEEGELIWIDFDDFQNHQFAQGMKQRLDLFTNDYPVEMFVEWNQRDGYTSIIMNKFISED